MGNFWGSDTEAVAHQAQRGLLCAGRIDAMTTMIETTVTAVEWIGNDADEFRVQASQAVEHARAVAEELRARAKQLRHHGCEQDKASNAKSDAITEPSWRPLDPPLGDDAHPAPGPFDSLPEEDVYLPPMLPTGERFPDFDDETRGDAQEGGQWPWWTFEPPFAPYPDLRPHNPSDNEEIHESNDRPGDIASRAFAKYVWTRLPDWMEQDAKSLNIPELEKLGKGLSILQMGIDVGTALAKGDSGGTMVAAQKSALGMQPTIGLGMALDELIGGLSKSHGGSYPEAGFVNTAAGHIAGVYNGAPATKAGEDWALRQADRLGINNPVARNVMKSTGGAGSLSLALGSPASTATQLYAGAKKYFQ